MQRVLAVDSLPESSLLAGAAFTEEHLEDARAVLAAPDIEALAIQLPAAGPNHTDWRTALARDLAREYAPKRVNIVSGAQSAQLDTLLAYLGNAPGVTGQYCQTHE